MAATTVNSTTPYIAPEVIKAFSEVLFGNYCYGVSRYVNKSVIVSDIAQIITNFLIEFPQLEDTDLDTFEQDWNNTIENLTFQVQKILMVIKPVFIDHHKDKLKLDPHLDDIDIKIQKDISKFIRAHASESNGKCLSYRIDKLVRAVKAEMNIFIYGSGNNGKSYTVILLHTLLDKYNKLPHCDSDTLNSLPKFIKYLDLYHIKPMSTDDKSNFYIIESNNRPSKNVEEYMRQVMNFTIIKFIGKYDKQSNQYI